MLDFCLFLLFEVFHNLSKKKLTKTSTFGEYRKHSTIVHKGTRYPLHKAEMHNNTPVAYFYPCSVLLIRACGSFEKTQTKRQ